MSCGGRQGPTPAEAIGASPCVARVTLAGEMRTFIVLVHAYVETTVPSHSSSEDCTGMISEHHRARIEDLLDCLPGGGGVRAV